MTIRARLFLLTAGAAVAALVPAVANLSSEKTPPIPPQAERVKRSSVRVEHELIVVKPRESIVVEPVVESVESAEPRVVAPRARPRPRADERGRETGFFSRARRLFVGDGRHRPAPFPRAGQ